MPETVYHISERYLGKKPVLTFPDMKFRHSESHKTRKIKDWVEGTFSELLYWKRIEEKQ